MAAVSWEGLDAVRAWSAVGVVLLHACVPYADPAMPGLVWSVADTPDTIMSILMWSIEVVIMPIFLVIAGFLTARSMQSRGASATTRSRLNRLGKPLLLAVVLLIPIELYIWLLGWVAEGQITPNKMRSLKFPDQLDQHLWGLSHLWFLQYLITYIAILGWVWSRFASSQSPPRGGRAFWACFAIAVATLVFRPEVVWGFQHDFLPVPAKWIYSGMFFAAGAFLWRSDPLLTELSGIGGRFAGPAAVTWIAAVCLGMWTLGKQADPTLSTTPTLIRLCSATLTVAAAAGVTFALIGMAVRHVRTLGGVTRFLAQASFSIYIFHHPVVGLAHITAKFALPDLSPVAKVIFVAAAGIAVGCAAEFLLDARRKRQAKAMTRTPETIPFAKPDQVPAKRAA